LGGSASFAFTPQGLAVTLRIPLTARGLTVAPGATGSAASND